MYYNTVFKKNYIFTIFDGSNWLAGKSAHRLQLLALRQRAEERQSQIEEKQLRKEQCEEVEVFLISLNDMKPTLMRLSRREIFDSWKCNAFVLQAVMVSNGGINIRSFWNFENIEPLSICK